MANNRFADQYEAATWVPSRRNIISIFEKLPPVQPDMHILDLACGTGSVTRVIYEECATKGVKPPSVTGLDIGDNFIATYKQNAAKRNWTTAEAFIGDASDLSRFKDETFDMVIMSFALFAVKDAVADTVAREIRRVLKPKGYAAFSTWRDSWVIRMAVEANTAVGRPESEWGHFRLGKWLKYETARDTLLAGGFEPEKVQHYQIDWNWNFGSKQGVLDAFSTPFWKGVAAGNWTEEQLKRWTPEIEKALTDEERKTGAVASHTWIFIAQK